METWDDDSHRKSYPNQTSFPEMEGDFIYQDSPVDVWVNECDAKGGCLPNGGHKKSCIDYYDEETHGYPNRAGLYDNL